MAIDWKDALLAKSEDTTPDIDADFALVSDTSASGALKKVLLKNLVGTALAALRSAFTSASSSSAASLAFAEDTDNGSNKITVTAPAAIASDKTLTLPDATDTLVGKATTDTLTNKSVDLANNTLTGTKAQFNTALSDGDFASLAGTETLSAKKISLTASHGSDDTYDATAQIEGKNAGATIAQWEAVYLDGSSTWQLADANGSGTYPARGLAVAAYSSSNPAIILKEGTVRNDAWAWTPGGTIYLSGTAGGLTQTQPSTSGDKVQAVGYALDADRAYFDFNSFFFTVT